MDVSKFVLRSIGVAAENRSLDSFALEVHPNEMLPFTDGAINSDINTHVHSGVDSNAKPYSAKVSTANSLKAFWLPFGSNRTTPPDIRRGERVLIYQYADEDKYYWKEAGLDDNLRRLETVIYQYSDTSDESVKVLDNTNSYMLIVSTHQKQITLTTSKTNGEPYAYTFQIDTGGGNVILSDDVGNFIQLNTPNQTITMKNQSGSLLSVMGNNIYGQCAQQINFTCDTLNIDATTAINVQTKTLTETLQTQNTNASDSINTTTPMFTQTGNFGVTGLATLNAIAGGVAPGGGGTPPMSVSASSTNISVPTKISASVVTTGTITNNGIPVDATHTHTSALPGIPTSPPI